MSSFADRLKSALSVLVTGQSRPDTGPDPDAADQTYAGDLSQPAATSDLPALVLDRVRRLAMPCAAIELLDRPDSSTDSYLAGFPYLPAGHTWPVDDIGPLVFVGQVNFGQVPPLPGFPTSGLLQWFTSASEDDFGLGRAVRDGAAVRWFSDLSLPSTEPPTAPVPFETTASPLLLEGPTSILFTPELSAPSWAELSEADRREPLWAELAVANGERTDELEFVYEEHARSLLWLSSKVGGYAAFTQQDPRGSDPYPAAESPAGRLILELDSLETDGWGDAGVGHLFGNPADLSRGDVSSVTYHWDCC